MSIEALADARGRRRSPTAHRGALTLIALALALAATVAAGCGLGAGGTPSGVALTVTRDFGSQTLAELGTPRIVGSDTVMRLLERNAHVTTAYGGGFVQSIDGYAGGQQGSRPVDWFYYVNGVEAPKGAAATSLRSGDHVWWDRHDWGASIHIPAVVGSFPEPFVHGVAGKRLPTIVECAQPTGAPCAAVARTLDRLGLPVARGGLLLGSGTDTLRVLVGAWPALRPDVAMSQIERGPQLSGVYARPDRSGTTLTLLDQRGRSVQTLGPGSGLVAATRWRNDQPVWVVTGTDAAGVSRAASAFALDSLHDRFALAISGADVGIPLPVVRP